jgi:hypothetical protein
MNDYQSEIERAIQNDLSAEDRALIERGRDLSRQKVEGFDLDNWIVIGLAHNAHVRLALRLANTNKRSGQLYTKYLSAIMKHHGTDDQDKAYKGILTALAFICEETHPERLEVLAEARAEMSPGEKAKLGSPHTARILIKKRLDQKSGYEPAPKAPSPIARLKQENEELKRAKADLEETLASSETQGSLFDWDRDKVGDISATLIASKPSKAKSLRDSLTAGLKALDAKKKQPAG